MKDFRSHHLGCSMAAIRLPRELISDLEHCELEMEMEMEGGRKGGSYDDKNNIAEEEEEEEETGLLVGK
eukprot:205133-Hanusia_phi.AAC.1